MGLMDMLSGGGGKRAEYEDFVKRYDKGEPHEGIDDEEARNRYKEVSGDLSDDDYELSAQEAFQRMSPQQRREFARLMRNQGRERGVQFGEYDRDDDEADQDPRHLAKMTRRARKQQPGGLAGLLGGGGGMLGNPAAKAALAGVAAMAAKRMFK